MSSENEQGAQSFAYISSQDLQELKENQTIGPA